jgi:hypothetical protein
MRLMIAVGAMLVVILNPAVTSAGLGIYADPGGESMCLNGPVVDLYFVYTGITSIQEIQFSAPVPSCADLTILAEEPVFTNTTGNLGGGVAVDFGECLTPPIHVYTVTVLVTDVLTYCCQWQTQDVSGVDCEGSSTYLPSGSGWLTEEPCGFVAPHSPVPEDGATMVPLDVDLEWEGSGPPSCDLGWPLIYILYFGTNPDSLTMYWDTGPPHPMTGLQPATTYYWQAEATNYNGEGPYPGPLWSFETTDITVPVDLGTWGRIKSLYR